MFNFKKNKKAATIETYRTSAAALAERYDTIPPRVRDIDEVFLLLRNKAQPRVFEIGFGTGKEAYHILKRTNHYTGIDISPQMVELASSRVPGGTFILRDLEKLEYPKHVDIIFAFCSLIHTDRTKLKKVFDAMHAALVPGGLARVSFKWGPKYKEVTKRDKYGTRTYYLYSLEDIKKFPADFIILKSELSSAEGQQWLELLLQKPTI